MPAITGFAFGDWQITMVSDGKLELGSPSNWFVGLSGEDLEAVMRHHFLKTGEVSLSQNIMLARRNGRTVMFDTGTGADPMLGPAAGKLMDNLRIAGTDPGSIDDIVLSHGHPDHIFGLVDQAGALNFPNAQVHVSEIDYRYFSDLANVSDPSIGAFIEKSKRIFGALAERLSMLVDGKEAVAGITALAAPGHTMGHMVFALTSGNRTLINAADIAHHFAVFMRHPEASFVSDMDRALMAATRTRLFDRMSTDGIPFVGYHFPFPGLGHVAKAAQGFRYEPASLDGIGF
ncbi:MBL fold metallo-hydrolase [Sinorhizobium fredii]|uniref:MBL fold metallo-hydrolase n=1 Tax=Rhizobium fredii TaxID=380 RepID=UPI0005956A6B|nr:MBL fold metallo-hydrolase [Sinorhizobium fredii]WOS65499.1 MBL fold metallo-hydrolase [Sinorhizobium fredii GR64]